MFALQHALSAELQCGPVLFQPHRSLPNSPPGVASSDGASSAIGTKIDTVDEIIEGPKSASRITLGIIYHILSSFVIVGRYMILESPLHITSLCLNSGGMPRRTRRWKRSGWARMYLWGWQLEKPGWMRLLDWCDKPWSYVLVEMTWEILT